MGIIHTRYKKKLDLPPDKIRILRDYDLKKKWNLVCDQRKMNSCVSITTPFEYLEKLAIYIDKKTVKKVTSQIELFLKINSVVIKWYYVLPISFLRLFMLIKMVEFECVKLLINPGISNLQ